jgi:predicted Zn-ribbon and HTH transcriptional regulator
MAYTMSKDGEERTNIHISPIRLTKGDVGRLTRIAKVNDATIREYLRSAVLDLLHRDAPEAYELRCQSCGIEYDDKYDDELSECPECKSYNVLVIKKIWVNGIEEVNNEKAI